MKTFWSLLLLVLPVTITSITVSSNGNSPKVKMIGGVVVDMQKGFVPMTTPNTEILPKVDNKQGRKLNFNTSKLSVNERYRRLIPYMTFYYANDLPPSKEGHNTNNIEVEKAEIVEASVARLKNKPYNTFNNVPRFNGNRANYNLQSINPTKIYKNVARPSYSAPDQRYYKSHLQPSDAFYSKKYVFKPSKAPSAPFSLPIRKPQQQVHYYTPEGQSHEPFYAYIPEKGVPPKYKLVRYEQSPPVNVHHENHYLGPKNPIPVPVLVTKEPVYVKQQPASTTARPQYIYETVYIQQPNRSPLASIPEGHYENFHPHGMPVSALENGFKPILSTTEHSSTFSPTTPHYESENYQIMDQTVTSPGVIERPQQHYYHYVVEEPIERPAMSSTVPAGNFIDAVQLKKSIPNSGTRDNMDASIRTLLQMLNMLKVIPEQNEVHALVGQPTPTATPKLITLEDEYDSKPVESPTIPAPVSEEVEFQQEPYLAPIQPPSQHIDEYHPVSGTSQRFPLHITSDDEGGTPGRPGIDYPTLEIIPPTQFDCKTQRYKGFFADPETKCQVWHYCDLNGGQASFLCPNGTIFSQAGLTCDWWFNVRCDSTTQLYVLNESLYKYILPHSPKFPEDYSGPLVDKYLTLKFKEMEEQFKKNKNKQSLSDDDEDKDSDEEGASNHTIEIAETTPLAAPEMAVVSEASVSVQNPGNTGNVERLQK